MLQLLIQFYSSRFSNRLNNSSYNRLFCSGLFHPILSCWRFLPPSFHCLKVLTHCGEYELGRCSNMNKAVYPKRWSEGNACLFIRPIYDTQWKWIFLLMRCRLLFWMTSSLASLSSLSSHCLLFLTSSSLKLMWSVGMCYVFIVVCNAVQFFLLGEDNVFMGAQ